MTTESYFIILVFVLLLVKFLQSKNDKESVLKSIQSLFSKGAIPAWLFFWLSLIPTLLVTNQVIGGLLILSAAWLLFFQFLNRLGAKHLAWWSLLIFLIYTWASYLGFDKIPVEDIWYLTLFSWNFAFILVLVLDILKGKLRFLGLFVGAITSVSLLLIPLTFIAYSLTFNIPLGENQLFAIYQTTLSESSEFMGMHSSFLVPVIILGSFILTTYFVFKQSYFNSSSRTGKEFFQISIAILFITSVNLKPHLPTLKTVYTTYTTYLKEIKDFKAELEKRKAGNIEFQATKPKGNEVYVVVIGESLNKNHMGMYGYLRETTPNLTALDQQGQIIKFDQAFSNHVHTVPVLTYALTEANQLNEKKFSESLSLLDIQSEAGFETYWISNQVAYGAWDNPVSVLAERADHRFNLNKNVGLDIQASSYDYQLVEKLKEILSKPITKNTVIYIHLLGNHGAYEKRYPEEYRKFYKVFEPKDFGSKDYWANHINKYDNSILYNDFVVSQIIESTQSIGGISACVYFSDYSEDVLANKGHDFGNFTFPMVQIPMMVWVSDDYSKKYPEKVQNLSNHTQLEFSNGLIYNFMIGFSGIETTHYDSILDISKSSYNLPLENCYTIHRERKIDEAGNYFYYEKVNIKALKLRGESARILPHRVNSKGKLSTVLYDGCSSFELDLVFREHGDSSYFEVGHDDNAMSGMSFEELLKFANKPDIQKIWLDVKNISKSNMESVLTRLNYLSDKFGLKDAFLVESGTKDVEFALLNENGFHTSYYLPTAIKDYDTQAQMNVAIEIAEQIKKQKVAAVSFDYRLYPFVKKHLENRISAEIVYHTWHTSFGFQNPDLIDNLDKSDFYRDARIKTLLVKYQSNFEL